MLETFCDVLTDLERFSSKVVLRRALENCGFCPETELEDARVNAVIGALNQMKGDGQALAGDISQVVTYLQQMEKIN